MGKKRKLLGPKTKSLRDGLEITTKKKMVYERSSFVFVVLDVCSFLVGPTKTDSGSGSGILRILVLHMLWGFFYSGLLISLVVYYVISRPVPARKVSLGGLWCVLPPQGRPGRKEGRAGGRQEDPEGVMKHAN